MKEIETQQALLVEGVRKLECDYTLVSSDELKVYFSKESINFMVKWVNTKIYQKHRNVRDNKRLQKALRALRTLN